MKCAWRSFVGLLPIWMRESVDKLGSETLQELRLRIGLPPELITNHGSLWLERCVRAEDLQFCINLASKYSPWTASTASLGYITAEGGHRIGLCGAAVGDKGDICGINNLTSLCLRVARDFPGLADGVFCYSNSILVIGKPGSGKTTLLRDLVRQRSNQIKKCVAVVDERSEIFPRTNIGFCFPTGKHTDVLSGMRKEQGIEAVLRNMSPDTIVVDEITAESDCQALIRAGWCGVKLIATAHAGSRNDLFARPVYQPIINSNLFEILLVINDDKKWLLERMNV